MQEDSSGGGSDGGGGGGGGGGSNGGGLRPEVRVEIGVTHMQVKVPHVQSNASSKCPNIRVPMFGVQTEFYLCRR
jgi:hypothetical protein